ncbi:hypothetical protein H9L39_17666 [Fusarium oxysporum f. sp. albedinis]|nr:hypothetical protein H9L39_17666 [Fusarium oxysporum f. sp. albedinis]
MENRYNDIDPAAEGTCKWLLRHDNYRDWTTCDRGLLWIKGKPGSGKSTLLRYAVCDAILTSSIGDRALVLSFFFHGRGAELQRTPLGFFRSLLHQLLRHVPDALPDLVTAFQQRCKNMGEPDKKWQWHLREIQSFFKSSLPKVLKDHSIWLFVDALDECGEENAIDLVEQFKSLLRELPFTDSKIHICFRGYVNLHAVSGDLARPAAYTLYGMLAWRAAQPSHGIRAGLQLEAGRDCWVIWVAALCPALTACRATYTVRAAVVVPWTALVAAHCGVGAAASHADAVCLAPGATAPASVETLLAAEAAQSWPKEPPVRAGNRAASVGFLTKGDGLSHRHGSAADAGGTGEAER